MEAKCDESLQQPEVIKRFGRGKLRRRSREIQKAGDLL
jgi:hypothetical protein